jgi:hypothetical protein
MKNTLHSRSRDVRAYTNLNVRSRKYVLNCTNHPHGRKLRCSANTSEVDTAASTPREGHAKQDMYNIVNDAIRSPEYDSGIG